MLGTILLAFALVFAILAAVNWPPTGRVSLGWLSIAFLIASMLFGAMLGR